MLTLKAVKCAEVGPYVRFMKNNTDQFCLLYSGQLFYRKIEITKIHFPRTPQQMSLPAVPVKLKP